MEPEIESQSSLKRHNSLALKFAESSRKKRKLENPASSHLCGHCNENLSLKVFRKHERLYKRLDQSLLNDQDHYDLNSGEVCLQYI